MQAADLIATWRERAATLRPYAAPAARAFDAAADELESVVGAPPAAAELTVEELAERLRRGASTIRTLLAAGEFPAAYKLRGKSWRIPAPDVAAFQEREAEKHGMKSREFRTRRAADTGEWRRHLRAG
jgi:excisionase family DNA binding protein